MSISTTPPVIKLALHTPALTELQSVLTDGLQKSFKSASVNVVDCPNLTEKPFMLAAAGICGGPRLADIGGPPFLLPEVQRQKIYQTEMLSKLMDLPGAFLIGAGAGPGHVEGVNSEMMCNVNLKDVNGCQTHLAKVDPNDGSCILKQTKSTEFMLMANLLCSEGKPGKVLEIKASHRVGDDNFPTTVRKILKAKYDTKPVALAGVFLLEKGKAKLHVMPDFSCKPLNSMEEVNNWLHFYEMKAPLVCLGELISHDPDLDLREEHFHCFSDHGEGGHYHYDITPDEVAYRAYFSVPETLYRIDKPPNLLNFGKD